MKRSPLKRRPAPDLERAHRGIVNARSGGRCEVTLPWFSTERSPAERCDRAAMPGIHHLTKRSQGGKTLPVSHKMAICSFHHDLADNASVTQKSVSLDGETRYGRLRITPRHRLPYERGDIVQNPFTCRMEYRGKKV